MLDAQGAATISRFTESRSEHAAVTTALEALPSYLVEWLLHRGSMKPKMIRALAARLGWITGARASSRPATPAQIDALLARLSLHRPLFFPDADPMTEAQHTTFREIIAPLGTKLVADLFHDLDAATYLALMALIGASPYPSPDTASVLPPEPSPVDQR